MYLVVINIQTMALTNVPNIVLLSFKGVLLLVTIIDVHGRFNCKF